MKSDYQTTELSRDCVAPRRGAWIEINICSIGLITLRVAPRRGAWIEIFPMLYCPFFEQVAPRRGAWIEIPYKDCDIVIADGRSPQGSVD